MTPEDFYLLTHLSITSLTLVDQLELEFDAGMSVVTGETGAGKSILLGALGLALGDRADSGLIAPGAGKAEVNATFDLANHDRALAWLAERELHEGSECILRRVVSKDGRSRAFINGSSINLSELKTLSEMLLDVHSQHEHQSLLKKETHRRLLDEFGGLGDVVAEVKEKFQSAQGIRDKLVQRRQDAEEESARVQLLSYQAEELANLAITAGETRALETEQKRLNSADDIQSRLQQALQICQGDEEPGASALLSRALSLLENINDESLQTAKEMLATASIQIDEAIHDLSNATDRFAADPGRLNEVENRLSRIYEAARKHKVQPDELPELTEKIQSELDNILNAEEQLAELDTQLAAAELAYTTIAEKLSSARAKTADLLQSEVTNALQDLGMNGAEFTALVEASDPNLHGINDIEFQIATIPGSEPGALSRIASGGELSRISLAIQVITATSSNTPTLIFDEVDVGVGGATAEVVGNLLRKLGATAQIVCVTHLPQVAAQGHQHYVVSKSTSSAGASTTVSRLTEEEKVDEIARMLGGIEKTDESMAHAESMLSSRGS